MTKTQKLLIALKNLITKPSSLRKMVDEEDEYRKYVSKKYGITQLPTVDLLDLFPDFSVTVNHYSFLEGTSLPTDIALLKLLAKRFTDCSYLEIGSWRGESISNVAEVAAKCLSITLSPDEMRAMGMTEDFILSHGTFSKNFKNIKTIEHNSMTFDFSSLDEKFDLIFVDGDHTHNAVKSDTQNVIQLLKDESSIIAWHDYAFNPDRVRYEVLAAILDGLPKKKHSKLYHISNTLCAVLINDKVKTGVTKLHSPANKSFSISLNAKKI